MLSCDRVLNKWPNNDMFVQGKWPTIPFLALWLSSKVAGGLQAHSDNFLNHTVGILKRCILVSLNNSALTEAKYLESLLAGECGSVNNVYNRSTPNKGFYTLKALVKP